MITLRPFYEEDLLEAEMYLAMQEYWDDLGSYWSNSSVEKKIIMMGRFLIHGGKLEDVIDRYKDGISDLASLDILVYLWLMDTSIAILLFMQNLIVCLIMN